MSPKIDRGPYSVAQRGTFYIDRREDEAFVCMAGFVLSDHQSQLSIGAMDPEHDGAAGNYVITPAKGESLETAIRRTMVEEFLPGLTFAALEEQSDPQWEEAWRAGKRKLALEVMHGTLPPDVEERSDGVYVAGERARQGDERENWRLVRAR